MRGHNAVQGLGQLDPGKGVSNPTFPPTRRNSCCCHCRQSTQQSHGVWLPSLGEPPPPGLLPARMSQACCWSWGLVPCQEHTLEGDHREIQNNLQIHKKTPKRDSRQAPERVCSRCHLPVCAPGGQAPVPGELAGLWCAGLGWECWSTLVLGLPGHGMGLLPPQDLASLQPGHGITTSAGEPCWP